MPKTKHIVVLGAGTGQAQILKGLRDKPNIALTSIVNVTDNGGSSKAVRESMNMPAPGDVRRCIETLADTNIHADMLGFRFGTGPLAGISLGNLLLAFHTKRLGNFGKAVEYISKELKTKGTIYPATATDANICVELKTGQKICGEWEIIRRRSTAPIARAYLRPRAPMYPKIKTALQKAALIVIAPGSLYTGIISILLMGGMKTAMKKASAKKIYIANIMTQPGQTEGMTIYDHAKELERYMGTQLDTIIINAHTISPAIQSHYKRVGSALLTAGDIPKRITVHYRNLITNIIPKEIREEMQKSKHHEKWTQWTHVLRHDPKKLTRAIIAELP